MAGVSRRAVIAVVAGNATSACSSRMHFMAVEVRDEDRNRREG
jgi:hypothetical protein